MKDNQAKYPQLRFKGFTDPWEDRKFFESIASTIDFRGRTPKKLGMDWSESGYLALSALNVKNGYIDLLADAHYGDENLYKKWMSGKELKKGQVLFTTEAPMGNVAQVPDNNGYILSQRTVAFETKEDMMTNDFLAVLLKSPLVFNNLSALSSGGTAKGVSQKSLKGLSITVPFDIDEQQKIGSFFKQLNDTIALHQRKLDLLKEQKKGYLQKMFPKNGAKVPELRFAGFADAWEQRKLGDYLSLPKKKKVEITNARDLMTLKLHLRGIEAGTGRETLSLGSTVYYKRLAGQFLYGKQNFFNGSMAIIPKKFDGKATSGDVPALDINGINSSYLYTYVSRHDYWKAKEGAASGTGSKRIHESTLLKFGIMVPVNNAEQQKIGSFFKQLDDTITLHQRKLEKLQELKKGYLQKMFC
ncbi:restriction endonuclease subunit S [Levilactobacillus cerevisiae]|uniref:restriction endonuclease subunit S n=1 Tax=Levilactobacillus cerevisiae TaxID=1704076 RepID=UPI00345E6241